ncbi:hypothetical protein JW935_13125 [candidate division KSB1 bacterium]|nr:hypothetical protein [candidate division KSB1 bacterium]
MKNWTIFVVVLVMAGLGNLCSVEKVAAVDFSGEWTFNESESEAGEGGRGPRASAALNVTQTKEKINIKRTSVNRDGEEMVREEEITLDGKENEVPGWRDNVRIVTAKWSDDGKSLTFTSESTFSREGEEFTMTSTEVWSLDGDNLVIDSKRSSPRGDRESKLVYNKKK